MPYFGQIQYLEERKDTGAFYIGQGDGFDDDRRLVREKVSTFTTDRDGDGTFADESWSDYQAVVTSLAIYWSYLGLMAAFLR